MAAPPPPDEALRLLVLQECDILDTPPDPVYDAVVALTADICEVPISLVSLIDEERQWFKARVGLAVQETPREYAFCAHCILHAETFEIEDTTVDDRFVDNPLVTGPPYIRFYAGFPIKAGDNRALGTLCVIDRTPRHLTEPQKNSMKRLANLISGLLQERRAAALARKAADVTEQHLRRLALTDTVTGLFNRRGFLDHVAWAGTTGGCLVLVEVDSLTAIRDELGLSAGDAVVKAVADLASRLAGSDDVVGRYDEATIAVFLPDRNTEGGRDFADHVRTLLGLATIDAASNPFSATVTAGVAAVAGATAIEPALEAADAALLEARALGGDQVVICARAAPPGPRRPLI